MRPLKLDGYPKPFKIWRRRKENPYSHSIVYQTLLKSDQNHLKVDQIRNPYSHSIVYQTPSKRHPQTGPWQKVPQKWDPKKCATSGGHEKRGVQTNARYCIWVEKSDDFRVRNTSKNDPKSGIWRHSSRFLNMQLGGPQYQNDPWKNIKIRYSTASTKTNYAAKYRRPLSKSVLTLQKNDKIFNKSGCLTYTDPLF